MTAVTAVALLVACTFLGCHASGGASDPIRVGSPHQLFVDDYLIESTHNLRRTVHPLRKHSSNPLMKPDRPWEGPAALLFGTVLREKPGGPFRMWYLAYNKKLAAQAGRPKEISYVCYAESEDGIRWTKPNLGLVDYRGSKENNIVVPSHGRGVDCISVIHDTRDTDASHRYKMAVWHKEANGKPGGVYAYFSKDGIHWKEQAEPVMPWAGDRTTVYFNSITGKFTACVRTSHAGKRAVAYSESRDFLRWTSPVLMLTADEKDAPDDEPYGLDGWNYETLVLGWLPIYHTERTYTVDIQLASSRDGRRWERVGNREVVIPTGPKGSWDYGFNHCPTNPPIRVGDELWCYYSGRTSDHRTQPQTGAVGLATLKVDRFVSMDADANEGTLTTKPVLLQGDRLTLNADARAGEIRAALLGPDGNPLPGYTSDACKPIKSNSLIHTVTWKGVRGLPNAPVRIQLRMRNARLYSFWVD